MGCANQKKKKTLSWAVYEIVSNIVYVSGSFSFIALCWVRRHVHFVGHEMTKFASSSSTLFLCCNVSSLPKSVLDAWRLDVVGCFV
jgi:hypothetical protein